MRSATIFVVVAASICLGSTGKAILEEPALYHPYQSGFIATKDYIDTDVEQFIEHGAEATKSESRAPIRSWSLFPMSSFFRFPCGHGRRVDANGRCRPIFLYKKPIDNQN